MVNIIKCFFFCCEMRKFLLSLGTENSLEEFSNAIYEMLSNAITLSF